MDGKLIAWRGLHLRGGLSLPSGPLRPAQARHMKKNGRQRRGELIRPALGSRKRDGIACRERKKGNISDLTSLGETMPSRPGKNLRCGRKKGLSAGAQKKQQTEKRRGRFGLNRSRLDGIAGLGGESSSMMQGKTGKG